MHDTAYEHGRLFFELYWAPDFRDIVEFGSMDVNGSLRAHAPAGARYVGFDMEPGAGVDLVVTPGEAFPLPDRSVDIAVTSSAFEHDLCFWVTFLDLMRLLRPGGLLYLNAPSNSSFHRYPVDCWRFYPDAGEALVTWATRRGVAVQLIESFVAEPGPEGWADFVAVFRKPSDRELFRRGRIADRTRAVNIRDSAASRQVASPQADSFDMVARQALRARLATAEATAEAILKQSQRRGDDLQAASARTASLEAELEHARREMAEMRDGMLGLNTRLAAMTDTLGKLEQRSSRAEAKLRRIKRSASWRLTAPLRRAAKALRPGQTS